MVSQIDTSASLQYPRAPFQGDRLSTVLQLLYTESYYRRRYAALTLVRLQVSHPETPP